MEKEVEMTLSQREWLVLKALWDIGAAELGELTEALHQDTGWSRNTVHTYLTRMEAKGLVRIDKEAYPHIYRAAVDRLTCQAWERRSFLHRVYDGAAGEMVAAFLRDEPITARERDRLRLLLDELEV